MAIAVKCHCNRCEKEHVKKNDDQESEQRGRIKAPDGMLLRAGCQVFSVHGLSFPPFIRNMRCDSRPPDHSWRATKSSAISPSDQLRGATAGLRMQPVKANDV